MTHNTRERIEEKLVKHLVDRFCGWHLPKDFHPDGGIMFMDVYDNGTEQGGTFEPTGTNLFTAEQAKEMFRFLLEHEDGRPILAELFHQELQKAREEVKTRTIIEDDLIEIAEMIANGNAFDKESGLIWQHVIDEAKRLCLLRDAIQASNHSELDQANNNK